MNTELCTLGGGCFWCLDTIFRRIKGVQSVVSGYSGSAIANPSYKQVCSGLTGHAEVVQITFDSDLIGFDTLLEVFFVIHDPTTLNRQGADTGTQYRSVIFYHNDKQRVTAEEMISKLDNSGQWPNPIVTQVVPLEVFYDAESYHQDYFNQNPENRYCQVVIGPKLKKIMDKYEVLVE